MSTRLIAPVRVVVFALCLLGVLAAVQRTAIAVLHQPRDASGFTAIERVVVEVMAGVTGIARGTPRYDDLVAGTLEFETKYEEHRALILLHVIPGSLILLLAPFQFSDRIRRRYVAYHRWTGRVLLVAVAISGISAFIFGLFMPFGGWRESAAVMVFGTLFFYAGARAWVAIRRRDVTTHREWMTRVFAVAVGIATTRVISIGLGALTTLSLREAFLVSLWAGFTSSVAAGEIIIRRARPRHMSMRAPAVSSTLALMLSASFAVSAGSQSQNADESAIRAARAQSNRAIAAHDADGVVRLMLPDYVGVSSANNRTIGRDAARASFVQTFVRRPGIVFVRTPRAISVNSAWGQAGESGRWTGTWSAPDGPMRIGGDYFAKWQKVGARWLLLTETFVQRTCMGGRYCDAPPVSIVQPPTPGLNHVYVGVDSATFTAMAASPFMREELGAFETRVTTRADGSSYSGAYLYGRTTYVELQQPSLGSPADRAQLYLGSDAPGDIYKSMERLSAGFVRTSFGMNTRRRGAENVPWFYLAWIIPSASEPQGPQPFMTSILEWHPGFLRSWFPGLPADSSGMSRAEYLAPLWRPGKYLRDVVGITFALDSGETARMAERLAMLGYSIRRSADTVVAVGGGLTVTAAPSAPGRHGTVALRFSLQRPMVGERVRRIGTSELRFGDGLEATWTFR